MSVLNFWVGIPHYIATFNNTDPKSGDAFLKYLASIYVFVTNPSLTEGALHVSRQKIISNRSLLFHASRIGMPAFIQSKAFAYKGWQPPNFRVYVPPKAAKDVRKDVGQHESDDHDGEIKKVDDGAVSEDMPSQLPLTSESTVDVKETTSAPLEAESIRNNLLRPSLEPGELVELEVDEVLMGNSATHEPEASGGKTAGIGNAESEPLDGEIEEDETNKEEKFNEDNDAKVAATKRKPKPKKKKSSADDQGTQSLGDKVLFSDCVYPWQRLMTF